MSSSKNKAFCQFGEALRAERKEKGFTQEKLALEADIDRSHMSGLERGEENVSLLTLLKIAAVLDSKPSKILERAGL